MKYILTLAVIIITNSNLAHENKGKLFLHWGYNRSAFTKSDIHFKGEFYDFILHNAIAKDRPTTFNTKIYLNPELFTIPQYVYRFGYFTSDKFSLSVGMDHMKYVLLVPSEASISGTIQKPASTTYAGTYDNTPITLSQDLVMFEHSDGLNYLSAEADWYWRLFSFGKENFTLYGLSGAGAGVYIPKTRVRVFGSELDNKFHLSGFGFSGHGRLRLYFKHKLYLTAGAKLGWTFLPDVLVDGADARANHNFGWFQYYAAIGGQFPLGNGKKKDHIDR